MQFVQRFHFDLHKFAAFGGLFGHAVRGCHGLIDSACGQDMVFLDEDGVPQSQPMVAAAAGPDRIFLRDTQTGQGLSRVDHLRAGAGNGVGVNADLAGNTGEQLEKIEGAAFG